MLPKSYPLMIMSTTYRSKIVQSLDLRRINRELSFELCFSSWVLFKHISRSANGMVDCLAFYRWSIHVISVPS